ncbi:MAG TPA: ATP-grasp domain-containing protein [Patescibacteria group bacterium]
MKIAFTYNLKPSGLLQNGEAEKYAEFDTPETINAIVEAIKANGFEVLPVEANLDTFETLRKHRDEIDLLFNFAEAVTITAKDREAHIPIIAEMLQIPYSGPTPFTAALRLNKFRTKEIWNYYGVPTPEFDVLFSPEDKLSKKLEYPLIVKANGQGSSSGIRNKSVVHNDEELYAEAKVLFEEFKGEPVLVERFLEGREFTVPVLGNGDDLMVLPIVEANFAVLPPEANKIDSYEAKWIWDNPEHPVKSTICPAEVSDELKKEIEDLAKKAFLSIGCRDWGRVDMRMDKDGKLYALEINSPVGLLPKPEDNSKLPTSARALGWSFEELVGRIVRIAIKRLGLLEKLEDKPKIESY